MKRVNTLRHVSMSQQALPRYLGVLAVLGHRLSGSDAAWRCNRQESDRAEMAGTPARQGGREARLGGILAVGRCPKLY